jgi:glycosyltransferase involved in cell wall biosynthesis
MIFFQNDDDRQLFIAGRLVRTEATQLLHGSGIDLASFVVVPPPGLVGPERPFRFLLIVRILRDKGVVEYVEAAQLLGAKWRRVEFCLLGFVDAQNPTAITRAQMDQCVASGFVDYLGASDDVSNEIARPIAWFCRPTERVHRVCCSKRRPWGAPSLPPMRWAVARWWMTEAMVFLCKVRDAADLAEKMDRMLSLSVQQRLNMGLLGREKMEREFDEQIVIVKYLSAIHRLA